MARAGGLAGSRLDELASALELVATLRPTRNTGPRMGGEPSTLIVTCPLVHSGGSVKIENSTPPSDPQRVSPSNTARASTPRSSDTLSAPVGRSWPRTRMVSPGSPKSGDRSTIDGSPRAESRRGRRIAARRDGASTFSTRTWTPRGDDVRVAYGYAERTRPPRRSVAAEPRFSGAPRGRDAVDEHARAGQEPDRVHAQDEGRAEGDALGVNRDERRRGRHTVHRSRRVRVRDGVRRRTTVGARGVRAVGVGGARAARGHRRRDGAHDGEGPGAPSEGAAFPGWPHAIVEPHVARYPARRHPCYQK